MVAVDVKKWLGGNVAEGIIRGIVVITMILGFVLVIRQDSLASCQARYDQAFAIYAKQTRENQDEVNQARDIFFRAFHEALLRRDEKTLEDVNTAFDNYFKTIEAFKEKQEQNPPPPLPETTCGSA